MPRLGRSFLRTGSPMMPQAAELTAEPGTAPHGAEHLVDAEFEHRLSAIDKQLTQLLSDYAVCDPLRPNPPTTAQELEESRQAWAHYCPADTCVQPRAFILCISPSGRVHSSMAEGLRADPAFSHQADNLVRQAELHVASLRLRSRVDPNTGHVPMMQSAEDGAKPLTKHKPRSKVSWICCREHFSLHPPPPLFALYCCAGAGSILVFETGDLPRVSILACLSAPLHIIAHLDHLQAVGLCSTLYLLVQASPCSLCKQGCDPQPQCTQAAVHGRATRLLGLCNLCSRRPVSPHAPWSTEAQLSRLHVLYRLCARLSGQPRRKAHTL